MAFTLVFDALVPNWNESVRDELVQTKQPMIEFELRDKSGLI